MSERRITVRVRGRVSKDRPRRTKLDQIEDVRNKGQYAYHNLLKQITLSLHTIHWCYEGNVLIITNFSTGSKASCNSIKENNEMYLNFSYAAVQQVPWIVLFGAHIHTHLENLVDDVRSVSTVPSVLSGFPMPMNFWQRLASTAQFMLFNGLMWWVYNVKQLVLILHIDVFFSNRTMTDFPLCIINSLA